jgi:hypothetical protein
MMFRESIFAGRLFLVGCMSAFLDRAAVPADPVIGADWAKAVMPDLNSMLTDACHLPEDLKRAAFQLLDSAVNHGIFSPEAG